MDSLVKQRLVGALILVALSVVFWPIIFVADTGQRPELRVAVPEAPPVDLTPLPEPDDLGLRQGRPATAQIRSQAEEPDSATSLPSDDERESLPSRDALLPKPSLAEAREQLDAPKLDEDGLPIAFSLQVATLADRSGAETLRDELISAGYKAYLKRLKRDDRTLFRVLVGPKYQRTDLVDIKDAIDKSWRVESMIIRYLP